MAEVRNTRRDLTVGFARVVGVFAFLLACYHLYVLGVSPNDPWIHRVIHLLGISILVFLVVPAMESSSDDRPTVIDAGLIFLAVGTAAYIFWKFDDLLDRLGVIPEFWDVEIATIACLLVLEMARRLYGWVLPGIALFFIGYAVFGSELPGLFGHVGYSFGRVITFIYSLEGIYGPPIAASATFVTLFVLFGSFLTHSGAGRFFVDLSYALAGGRRGGPAKVAVLASAFFGSISGSAVSNAVTTGTFTIPLMRTVGYRAEFAAAVEAVASAGGQLMPPIMSATAFVMAEMTGIPYLQIASSAIVPSLLYFLAVYFMIDLEAKNLRLLAVPKEELPVLRKVVLKDGHLLLPIIVIIYALVVMQTSPLRAALLALITIAIVSWARPWTRMNMVKIYHALGDGMKVMMDIGVACALAGVIVGVFSLTGVGLKFASALVVLSGGHLWLALVITMIVCIILGMGMPTLAAYVVTVAAVGPALTQLGVPVLAAHLFVLYFAAISTITPPVAVTVFATAGMAGASPMRVGVAAVKLGIAAYIVPFMFVYSGSLLLLGDVLEIALAVPSALVGVWSLAKGLQDRAIHMLPRCLFLIAALLLITPEFVSDLAGLGIVALSVFWAQKME
jgi:TRAP transporter 4TM/12TM fusion protein